MMQVQINGEAREVPDDITVAGLLEHLQIVAARVAVEVNADVVKRADHVNHLIRPGDAIEVVAFVGGG